MKQPTYLLLAASMVFATACKRIILKAEGIKQPVLENQASLAKFLRSYDIDTSEILCFRNQDALNAFYKMDISIPDSRFFNREKQMVDYRTTANDCNGKVSVFIEKADSINRLAPIPERKLEQFLQDVVTLRTGQKFVLEDQNYDVYLLVYWAKYMGKVNKHKVFEWQKLVQKAQQDGQKIRMILINTDYQSLWGIGIDQVPEFDF